MAKELENGISSIGTVTDNIEDIAFSDVWSGDVYNAQIELLKGIVVETRNLESEFETFKSKVAELGEYKELLETIEQKEATLNGMEQYTTYKDIFGKIHQRENYRYTRLKNEIDELKSQASSKRKELMTYFNNSVAENGEEGSSVDYMLPDNLDYTNVDSIINAYFAKEGSLRMFAPSNTASSTGGLYKLYEKEGGKQYIFNRLMTAMNKAGNNGRQRSVNAVVELFNLSVAKGYKIPYINKGCGGYGSFVTTDCVATGVDCNAFVCWGVDKGVPNGFQWRPCIGPNGLDQVGTKINYEDWSQAKSGDIFSRVNGSGQHAVYLLKNNPESRTFVLAEASGQLVGIRLKTVTYEQMRAGGMELRNMDKVYTGEDQASRFNSHQPHDNNYSKNNPELH